MAVDDFRFEKDITGPATRHYTITPSDTVDLPRRPRILYCMAAGNVAVQDAYGTVITYAMEPKERLEFRGTRIRATGTTAVVIGWE